ncbi:MAG TPA: hypothetical protein VGF16_18110 [Bryobacteraceae bacterium]
MRAKILAGAVVALGTLLSACAPSNGYVGVGYGAPPPPRYGVVGVAPGPGYVWTDGFWDYRGGGWAWAPGRWVRPPYRGARWAPGYWDRSPRGYRFHAGRWHR